MALAIIDPKGLFLGDRINMCSDLAQLHWPRLYAASNNFARVELNYRNILASAYSSFKKKPGEKQFWDWIEQYRRFWLLFVYRADGQLWGQWQTNERYLPGYKTSADHRSPAPPKEEQEIYRNAYLDYKAKSLLRNQRFTDLSKVIRTTSLGVGIGIGVGVGVGEVLIAPSVGEKTAVSEPHTVFDFPALRGETYQLPVTLYESFGTAYPGIDVMAEMNRAKAWLLSNPTRQKTLRGMSKFLNTWLARAQNCARIPAGVSNGTRGINRSQERTDATKAAAQAALERLGLAPGDADKLSFGPPGDGFD